MTLVLAVLNGLAAIPAIAGYIEQLAAVIVLWYVQRQTNASLAAIADAAALAAKAKTDADRYAAAQAWQDALARARVTSS